MKQSNKKSIHSHLLQGDNYEAWRIELQDFYKCETEEDKFKFLIRFAVLAPSSHNSQPWMFSIQKGQITVYPNPTRRLPFSDKDNRQLYISLGCAIENLVIAARYYGYKVMVEKVDGETFDIRVKIFDQEQKVDKIDVDMLEAIPTRSTNRFEYENEIPSEAVLNKMSILNSFSEVDLVFISNKKQRMQIADAVVQSTIEAMDYSEFRQELSHYLKWNYSKQNVGMTGQGLGMPTPISIIAPFLISQVNLSKKSRSKDESLLKEHTPTFGIISSMQDEVGAWINVGRLYQRIALSAHVNGIATSVLASAIEIGEYYRVLQKFTSRDMRPQLFFRLGYPKKPSIHSPRASFNDVIISTQD